MFDRLIALALVCGALAPSVSLAQAPARLVALGDGRVCFLTEGRARCVGRDSDVVSSRPGLTSLAVDPGRSRRLCAVAEGRVVCGDGPESLEPLEGASGIAALRDGVAIDGAGDLREIYDGRVRDSVAVEAEATSVSLGHGNRCVVTRDGHVECWGQNRAGVLGRARPTHSATPMRVPGVANAVDVFVGFDHACALRADARLVCWGNVWHSSGDAVARPPRVVRGLRRVTSVALSGRSTCVTHDGHLSCWAHARDLPLIPGEPDAMPVRPTRVPGIRDATQVVFGRHHISHRTCIRRSGDVIECLGDDPSTRATVELDRPVQVATRGTRSCAVTENGDLYCWGRVRVDEAWGTPRRMATGVARVYLGGDDAFRRIYALGRDRRVRALQLEVDEWVDLGVEGATDVAFALSEVCVATQEGRVPCTAWPRGFSPDDPVRGGWSMRGTTLVGTPRLLCGLMDGAVTCQGPIGGRVFEPRPSVVDLPPVARLESHDVSVLAYLRDGRVAEISDRWGVSFLEDPSRLRSESRPLLGHTCAIEAGVIECRGSSRWGQIGSGEPVLQWWTLHQTDPTQ